MNRVFVYAVPHEEKHQDKVLVIRHPDTSVLTLPHGEVSGEDRYPDWSACEILKKQTGYNIFPDRRTQGFVLCDGDFFRSPILKGKITVGAMKVLCYQVEVNERHQPEGDALWLPWSLIRHDDRVSSLSRFITALLYSGISGWELSLDDSGVWRVPCMSVAHNRSDIIGDILSGEIKVEMSDTFDDIIKKSTDNFLNKYREKKPKKEQPMPLPTPKKRGWFWWLGL